MGSFAYFTIDGYPFFETKNSYYTEIVNLLFLSNDFISEQRLSSSRNSLMWGDAFKKDTGKYTFKGFKQTVHVCKERLEIYGMSLKNAKKDFNIAKTLAKIEGLYSFPIQKVSFEQL